MRPHAPTLGLALAAALLGIASPQSAFSQCPANPPVPNHDGGVFTVCHCFIPGEQAGAVFNLPPADYPLEVLQVNIYWASQFGGNPPVLEQAIHLYNGGLPNPGAPIYTMPGPTLNDNSWNAFPLGSPVPVAAGPVTATLEFLNQSSGNQFASGPAEDGACRPNQNVVFSGGVWSDACALGVPGDWVMELVYRPCTSPVQALGATWGHVKAVYR